MKKRIQKAIVKTLPFLAFSLFMVFLLSWTFEHNHNINRFRPTVKNQ